MVDTLFLMAAVFLLLVIFRLAIGLTQKNRKAIKPRSIDNCARLNDEDADF